MAGQVAHEGVGDLLGVARDRQVDAQHLGLLVAAQRIVAQNAAVQAHLELDAGHAEIVAGEVLDLGRPLVDADRTGEVDRRSEVGNDMEFPAGLLVAARLQGDLLALGDDVFDLVLALADGRELGLLAVDRQDRRLAATRVIDEARNLAADRYAQNLVVLGHVQIDRRLAGIGRRRDPQVGNDRRRRRESRGHGGGHAITAPAARHGDGDDESQQRHEAQRPLVEGGEARMSRPIAQAGKALGLTATMGFPQGHGHRIGIAGGQLVLHGGQRPVRNVAVALEPTDRRFARGPRKITKPPPGETGKGQRDGGQNAGMDPRIEAGEQVEMGGGNEERDEGEQRHEARPQAFPSQGRPRQTDFAAQSRGPDRRSGLAGVHRRPFVQAFFGSIQGGNRSAEIISSTVGLGRVTANLVPSTITSGANGRLL